MSTITVTAARMFADLLPGDTITAVDGRPLLRQLTVELPVVNGGRAMIRLRNPLGTATEWNLYADQVEHELTVTRNDVELDARAADALAAQLTGDNGTLEAPPDPTPAPVGRGVKDLGYIARKWGHAHNLSASGSGHIYANDRAAYDALPAKVRGDGLPPLRQTPRPGDYPLRARGTTARYAVVMAGWATVGRILEELGIIVEHEGRWYFTDRAEH